MITISEKTPPKSSYRNILENPVTKKIFINTLSQLGIEDTTKEAIMGEFRSVLSEFTDPTYTGDIKHFKVNLYTTLTETGKEINLVDVLSTEEFVARSTEMIQNLIYIKTLDNNNLTLEEYIRYYSQIRPERHHILPVLRGLYRREPNNKIYRDTSEIVAALKKHMITHTESGSTTELSSLVEKSKQNEVVLREDEVHYNNIKPYTEKLPEDPKNYLHMMNKIDTALEYFSNSTGYKKEKLDSLMNNFIINLTKHGLSKHGKKYGYLGADVFSIEYEQKLDINNFANFLNKYPEYKNLVIDIMKEKVINLEKDIIYRKEKIKTFSRPTREERCSRAPYRGAPIKSDQEYESELGNLKLNLDMDEKNFALFNFYLLKIV